MKSVTTSKFRKSFNQLPDPIKSKATDTYALWLKNPRHPSLHFKKIKGSKYAYSVRIDLNYRAIGALKGDTMIWFWIGSHEKYEEMIRTL